MKSYLVIDDDEIFRFLNTEVIYQVYPNAEVNGFTSGIEAVQFVQDYAKTHNKLPDVIFCDLRMPEMSGFEVLDEFMKMPRALFEGTTIIMLSSSLDEKDHRKVLSYPIVTAFKGKPLSVEILEEL